MPSRHRQRFHALHLHLGLWAGVLFVLLGLSGSVLTFYPELDALLNPTIRPFTSHHDKISVQKAYEVLRQEYPNRSGSWRIEMPLEPHNAIAARYYQPVETASKRFAPLMVTIDPLTYQVTSSRFWGDYPATWIYDLHYTLLSEEWGHNTVGLLGLLLLASLSLGIALWVPARSRLLRAMRPVLRQPPVKRIYDWHMLCGIYGGGCLAVVALTGVILSYPQASQQLASSVFTFQDPMPAFEQVMQTGQAQAPLDDLIERSKEVFPRAEVRWIETSGENGRAITLRLFHAAEPSRRFPQTYLKMHPVTGEVLYQRDFDALPLGNRIWAWVHPLHNGEAFGVIGRVIVSLLGWLPAVLWVTGVLRFMHKRKARSLIAAKKHTPPMSTSSNTVS